MSRILLAVDGSENSWRAVEGVIQQQSLYKTAPEIFLLNVQPALSGDVVMFVGQDQIKKYHQEEGLKALAVTRDKLTKAGIAHTFHIGVGDPAHVIVKYAKEKHCQLIAMGTRGMGAATGLLLGSVATKVVHLSDVPILLIK